MRVLLLAMPDVSRTVDYFIRFPNLAIVSMAGNLPGHEVKALDLVTCKPRIRKTLTEVLNHFQPDIVGLSAMTFQFDTLLRVAGFVRRWNPEVMIAAGGYHVTLLGKELTDGQDPLPLDFIIRGEGEIAFRNLVEELEKSVPDLSGVSGLSYRKDRGWAHNPIGELTKLESLALPRRKARLSQDFYALGWPADVVETSRGCPHNCNFCSITYMYGRKFRPFPIERVIEDLKAIREQGTRVVFFTDDNIIFDVDHFQAVCRRIIEDGLNDIFYTTQASAVTIARNPELVAEMARANFRAVFVGFESMDPLALKNLKKTSSPEINLEAASLLRKYNIAIIAGGIFGYPDDDRETVIRQYNLYKRLRFDLPYTQFLTPYPRTRIRNDLLEAGLVTNPDDFRRYDGFTSNIRTRQLSCVRLYRLLRIQDLKTCLNPSFILGNAFLRMRPFSFLKKGLLALRDSIYNIIAGHPRIFSLDI